MDKTAEWKATQLLRANGYDENGRKVSRAKCQPALEQQIVLKDPAELYDVPHRGF